MFVARVQIQRSAILLCTLLLSSAIAAPAFAQIEEVVVTAQKKSEDIQTVPIAISAFTGADLAAYQIKGFSDLQFAVPNVTMSNSTYGKGNFQIRGIGTGSVTASADPGVSINRNQVYLSFPALVTGSYYDIERIEVARGPQGTLFGQNATGGAVDIITAKPQLDKFSANLEGTYGNYNFRELRAMLNIPLIRDQLGIRLAFFREWRGGDITNIYPALHPGSGLPSKLDSRSDWSGRASIRWEPSDKTTVDVLLETSRERDSHVRTSVQACTTDPSGILGCLPSARRFQPINLNATTNAILLSNIGPAGGTPFQLFQITGPSADHVGSTAIIPSDMRSVNTDFQPLSVGQDYFGSLTWRQKIFPWLTSTFIGAFDHKSTYARQATTGTPGDAFSLYPSAIPGLNRVQAMERVFMALYPISGTTYFSGSHYGLLPISAPVGYGLSSGNIRDYANHMQGYDQIGQTSTETSLELRFASNFQGPFNFLFGLSHLEYHITNPYYVAQTGVDTASILFGALLGPPFGDGVLAAPSIYDNNTIRYTTKSNALFGEVYYEIVPNTLKLTLGARWTEDKKTNFSQQSTLACPAPIGSTASQITAILASTCPASFLNPYGALATRPLYQKAKFSSTTGRVVLDWTPKLNWTDQTMVYVSYSHGNRPGGFNPPSFIPGLVPKTFAAENVNAYEVGAKNLFLDGTLQANGDFWYYDYKNYQIASIVNRSSLNVNINSTLYGVEGELVWAPEDTHWRFNLNFGVTQSQIGSGNDMQVDTRDPTHGNPDAMLLKDYQGSNCVIQSRTGPVSVAQMNALAASVGRSPQTFIAPPVALPTSVAASSAFINGSLTTGTFGLTCAGIGDILHAINQKLGTNQFVVTYSPQTGHYLTPGGIPVSVKGNHMPSTPPINISAGVQYTFEVEGYALIPRLDYYWRSKSYASIFNTAEDVIPAWGELNAQVQLNSPDGKWYGRLWAKNMLDSNNVTATYTGADAQGLYSNMFVLEPRTFGLTLGVHL